MKVIRPWLLLPSKTTNRAAKAALRQNQYGGPHIDSIRKNAYLTQDAWLVLAQKDPDMHEDVLKAARAIIITTDEMKVTEEVVHDHNDKTTAGGVYDMSASRMFATATAEMTPQQLLESGTANSLSVWMKVLVLGGKVTGEEVGSFPVRNQTASQLLEQYLEVAVVLNIVGYIDVVFATDAASTNKKAMQYLATHGPMKITQTEQLPLGLPTVRGIHNVYSDFWRFFTFDNPHSWKSERSQFAQGGDTKDLLLRVPGTVRYVPFSWNRLEVLCHTFSSVWCGQELAMHGGSAVSMNQMFAAVKSNTTKMHVGSATKFFSNTFRLTLGRISAWISSGKPSRLDQDAGYVPTPEDITDMDAISAVQEVQLRMDRVIDISNGIVPGSGGKVETLTHRDTEKLSHLRSTADYFNDMYQDLSSRPGYNAARDFIHATTRHTFTAIQYSNTSFVTWFTRDFAPNCGWPGVYIRLLTTDFLEHLFAWYRSAIPFKITIKKVAEQRHSISNRRYHHLQDYFLNGWRVLYDKTLKDKMRSKKRDEEGKHRAKWGVVRIGNCCTWHNDNDGIEPESEVEDDEESDEEEEVRVHALKAGGRKKARKSVLLSSTITRSLVDDSEHDF